MAEYITGLVIGGDLLPQGSRYAHYCRHVWP